MTQTHNGVNTKGAIDADGHILEPPDLWEKDLEPKYRDRALRIRTNSDGLEYMEVDGKPMWTGYPGMPGSLGGMGDPEFILFQSHLRGQRRSWLDER